MQRCEEYKEFKEFRSSRSSRSSGGQEVATSENSRKTLFWEIENGRPPG
jgi:hypothetical protein